MNTTIHHGNNLEILPTIPDHTFDAIITDPPYELGFMGKKWDASGIAYNVTLWAECLRVLKPGGHLLAFGGTRTYHRMACAIEDAGFEIRDSIHWIYGSGFPKSLDVSKAIDKQAGAERKVVGHGTSGKILRANGQNERPYQQGQERITHNITAPATDAAKRWEGWGTALKPAHEPIVLARKPFTGTVANNVLEHGTGALNIDACRIGFQSEADERESKDKNRHADFGTEPGGNNVYGDYSMVPRTNYDPSGRWPANVIHDGSDDVIEGFPHTKATGSGKVSGHRRGGGDGFSVGLSGTKRAADGFSDSGSASRFFASTPYTDLDGNSFIYCAKPGRKERNAGLDNQNTHPTVKPIALMRYLIRLVTPPNGTILDPFAGSGTTLTAATLEGIHSVGIELTEDYIPIIKARTKWAAEQPPTLLQ